MKILNLLTSSFLIKAKFSTIWCKWMFSSQFMILPCTLFKMEWGFCILEAYGKDVWLRFNCLIVIVYDPITLKANIFLLFLHARLEGPLVSIWTYAPSASTQSSIRVQGSSTQSCWSHWTPNILQMFCRCHHVHLGRPLCAWRMIPIVSFVLLSWSCNLVLVKKVIYLLIFCSANGLEYF